jgi:hypothetical protein
MVRDYSGIVKALMGEYDKTSQPLRERASILPLGQYEDGSVGLAFPQILAAPAEAWQRMVDTSYSNPVMDDDQLGQMSRDSFDAAGLAMTSGLGAGLAGGLADDALKATVDLPASAAFKFGDEIFDAGQGRYHANAIRDAVAAKGKDAINATWDQNSGFGDMEGFVSLGGNFQTRKQAADAIRSSGKAGDEFIGDELHASTLNDFRSRGLWANAPTGSSVPLATNALERQPQGIRAYHGSPHDFDKFSLDKIGTGEGAQAYGHGLYFADNEDVARSYRDSLSADGLGQVARGRLRQFNGDMDKTIEYLQQRAAGNANSDAPFAVNNQQALAELEAAKAQGITRGRMYEVNIKANPEDFLDWDKPLSQQSEAVRRALVELGIDENNLQQAGRGELAHRTLVNRRAMETTGDDPVEPWVTEQLKARGIPGIRYFDGMSRAHQEGSQNMVVFDDALVDILRKYANAPTGAAIPTGMEASQGEDMTTDQILKILQGGR